MTEGQQLILNVLNKACDDAQAKYTGLGMCNVANLSASERAILDKNYRQAEIELDQAKRAVESYLRQLGKL